LDTSEGTTGETPSVPAQGDEASSGTKQTLPTNAQSTVTGRAATQPSVFQTVKAASVRAGASLISSLLAVAIVATAKWRDVHSATGVCLLNLAELGNLLLFRSLKVCEYWFDGGLHAVYQEREDRYADVRRKMGLSTGLAGAVYFVALLYVLGS
jgi:hypothetical protein